MMGEHPAYHQSIAGDDAVRRLKRQGGHCYLTRYSKVHECYVLSVLQHQKPMEPVVEHFALAIKNGGIKVAGKYKTFDNIGALLQYYEHNRIDPGIKSIGQALTEDDYLQSKRRTCIIL